MKNSKKSISALIAFITSIHLLAAQAASPVPAQLPRPDGKPGDAKKPVKVYILSGQSNMVGFGTVSGANPVYPGIYLSPDPSVMPCRMPVGESALLPHRFYQESKGDAQGAKAAIFSGAYDPQADYAKLKPVKESVVALGKVSGRIAFYQRAAHGGGENIHRSADVRCLRNARRVWRKLGCGCPG